MEEFVTLDVETANADLGSICQLGVVRFTEGQISDSWQSLVDPDDYFDPMNISIHGINEESVKGAPQFPGVIELLRELLDDRVVVTHGAFDKLAVSRACDRYQQPTARLSVA